MAATINHYGFKATVQGGQWTCNDRPLLGLLKKVTRAFIIDGAEPNPDLAIAQEVIRRLGGTIEKADKTEYNPDVVY